MNKLFRLLAICGISVAFATFSNAWAQRYTSVDYPGAIATNLYGSSPDGTYIGIWTDTGGVTHGFFLKRGAFTSFDVPGSTSTFPYGITSQGIVVGE